MLRLLELVDRGAQSVSELGVALGVDKSTVSRGIAELEREGWVTRSAGRLELGPRSWVLARGSQGELRIRRAGQVADAVAAATGLWTQVVQLVGRRGYLLADARPVGAAALEAPTYLDDFPLWATAMGHCLLAQLDPAAVRSSLPRAPYPAVTPHTVTAASDLTDRLDGIRNGRPAIELHEYVEGWGCVALPWLRDDPVGPWTIAVTGWADTIVAQQEIAVRTLQEAVRPDASATRILATGRPSGPS